MHSIISDEINSTEVIMKASKVIPENLVPKIYLYKPIEQPIRVGCFLGL